MEEVGEVEEDVAEVAFMRIIPEEGISVMVDVVMVIEEVEEEELMNSCMMEKDEEAVVQVVVIMEEAEEAVDAANVVTVVQAVVIMEKAVDAVNVVAVVVTAITGNQLKYIHLILSSCIMNVPNQQDIRYTNQIVIVRKCNISCNKKHPTLTTVTRL